MEYEVIDGKGIIPDGVTEIGKEAFAGCTNLQSLVIPNSVKVIEEGAFYYCTSLKSIIISSFASDSGGRSGEF